MNPRRLLGKLNTRGARTDIERGDGRARIDASDVAGALGMMRERLGRDVMLMLWSPGSADLTRAEVLGVIAERMYAEVVAQRQRITDAQLELFLHKTRIGLRHPNEGESRLLYELDAKVTARKRVAWPMDPGMLARIREAALDEMIEPNHCATCKGLGELMLDGRVVECEACDGRGHAPISDRKRADRVGRDESTYRLTWRGAYEFAHAVLAQAERRAARELAERLGA